MLANSAHAITAAESTHRSEESTVNIIRTVDMVLSGVELVQIVRMTLLYPHITPQSIPLHDITHGCVLLQLTDECSIKIEAGSEGTLDHFTLYPHVSISASAGHEASADVQSFVTSFTTLLKQHRNMKYIYFEFEDQLFRTRRGNEKTTRCILPNGSEVEMPTPPEGHCAAVTAYITGNTHSPAQAVFSLTL